MKFSHAPLAALLAAALMVPVAGACPGHQKGKAKTKLETTSIQSTTANQAATLAVAVSEAPTGIHGGEVSVCKKGASKAAGKTCKESMKSAAAGGCSKGATMGKATSDPVQAARLARIQSFVDRLKQKHAD